MSVKYRIRRISESCWVVEANGSPLKEHATKGEAVAHLARLVATRESIGAQILGPIEEAEGCYIEERGGKFVVVSNGKVLGEHDTRPEAEKQKAAIAGRTQEAEAKRGSKWAVCVISEGLSKNRTFYPSDALARGARLYEGAKVFWGHEMRDGVQRDPRDTAGFLRSAKFSTVEVEGRPAQGAILAVLHATSPALREMLLEAHEADNPDLVGLSHSVLADSELVKLADGPARRVKDIKAVESVDVVSFPSAGGRVMRLVAGLSSPVEATTEDLMTFAQKLAKLQESAPALYAALGKEPTEAEVDALLRVAEAQAAAQAKTAATPPPASTTTGAAATPQSGTLTEADRQMLREAIVSNSLNGRTLPEPIKESIKASLLSRVDLTSAIAKEEVDRWVAAQTRVAEGQRSASAGRSVEVTKDEAQKLLEECEGFSMAGASDSVIKAFEAEHGRKPAKNNIKSFRRLYEEITGDVNVTGYLSESTKLGRFSRLLEQVQQTSFPALWLDSQRKRMVAEYRGIDAQYTQWRQIVSTIQPVRDFGLRTTSTFGSLGDLAIVPELGPYVAFANPTDASETYTPQKRGRILQISREAILRDDVGLIQRFPREIGRAAARTLNRFVFSRLTNNALMGDGVALFAAAATRGYNALGNIIATALSEANITEARLRLQLCPDRDGNNVLGLSPYLLLVPPQLANLGWQLTQMPVAAVAGRNATEPNMVRELYGLTRMLVVPELFTSTADANNYYILANPLDVETIEMSFINGQEEPELFLQQEPTSGAMFTNDALTYKPRHEYGGTPIEWRGMIGGIVP